MANKLYESLTKQQGLESLDEDKGLQSKQRTKQGSLETPAPGFEPGNPCGNEFSKLAE